MTIDELNDPDDLGLGCSVDGETLQDARATDLIFAVSRAGRRPVRRPARSSPGDLLFTGTPGGVGIARQPPRFLQPGTTLETWIEGIGTIRNPIIEGH